ncbi:MAG: hypothetical protein AB7F75_00305 [Planctomycetota bacterium]
MPSLETISTRLKKVKELSTKAQKDHRKKQLKKQAKRLSRKGYHLKARAKRLASKSAQAEGEKASS